MLSCWSCWRPSTPIIVCLSPPPTTHTAPGGAYLVFVLSASDGKGKKAEKDGEAMLRAELSPSF